MREIVISPIWWIKQNMFCTFTWGWKQSQLPKCCIPFIKMKLRITSKLCLNLINSSEDCYNPHYAPRSWGIHKLKGKGILVPDIHDHRTKPRPLHLRHSLCSILQCRHVFREPQEVLTHLLCLLWNRRESSQCQLMQQITTRPQHCTSIICQAHCNQPKSYTDQLQIHVISWAANSELTKHAN